MLYLLDSYHCYYESFQIYKKHAEYLTLLARAARSAEEKHELYSQALAVYCEACQLADTVLYDVHTTSSLQVLSVCLSVRPSVRPSVTEGTLSVMHGLSCTIIITLVEINMLKDLFQLIDLRVYFLTGLEGNRDSMSAREC